MADVGEGRRVQVALDGEQRATAIEVTSAGAHDPAGPRPSAGALIRLRLFWSWFPLHLV